jgi:hypothetical protein
MPWNPVAGKLTKLLVGTAELAVENVQWSEKSDIETLHPSTANGFMMRVVNFQGATLKISGGYNLGDNYHADPPDISTGAALTGVHAKPDGTLDYAGDYVVEDFQWTGGGKNGAVKFEATLLSNGAYTKPTGA